MLYICLFIRVISLSYFTKVNLLINKYALTSQAIIIFFCLKNIFFKYCSFFIKLKNSKINNCTASRLTLHIYRKSSLIFIPNINCLKQGWATIFVRGPQFSQKCKVNAKRISLRGPYVAASWSKCSKSNFVCQFHQHFTNDFFV